MIRNEAVYRLQADEEARAVLHRPAADSRRPPPAPPRAVLHRMSVAESIAIGEALLTSDLMRLAVFPEHDRPRSLAIALGIDAKAAARRWTCRDGRE
jgi:hypothetical protein